MQNIGYSRSNVTFRVKTALRIKVLVFDGHGSVLQIRADFVALDRHPFNGIIILPKQGLAGTVIITDTSPQIAAGNVLNTLKILAEISEDAQGYDKHHHNEDADDFQSHDAAVAAEPKFGQALGMQPP